MEAIGKIIVGLSGQRVCTNFATLYILRLSFLLKENGTFITILIAAIRLTTKF